MTSATAIEQRFLNKVQVDEDSGCWEWTAYTNASGYGAFGAGGRGSPVLAHRWSYEHFVGPIPDGLQLDHLCRNRPCVNPAHLEPVTLQENIRRGYWANRTHCPQGHPYDEKNTYVRPGFSTRACRACWRQKKSWPKKTAQ